MSDLDRRTLLRVGSIATLGGLAGCSGDAPRNTPSPEPTEEATGKGQSTATDSGSESGSADGIPGADELGGPANLKTSPTVRAATLESDQGAGRFVFTPAVVWVERGATVTWSIEGASHSVTAYHPDNDRPQRIPRDAAAFDSGVLAAGKSYEHTFETPGVYNYYCTPHESLGMVGVVVVEEPDGGPGMSAIIELSGAAATNLRRQLGEVAGFELTEGESAADYGWQAATWDSYWYSLYNMSTNIAMSGNGVLFPSTEAQREAFEERFPAMLSVADTDKPPIRNPNLNMLPFTEGNPTFTQEPVFDAGDGRPDASTLAWDKSKSSFVVSPASLAWTHLKGVTWAKNFENHFDVLPPELAAKFRSMVLSTLAQLGVKGGLVDGGPQSNGLLTKGDSLELLPGVNVREGKPTGRSAGPSEYSAMLWFLSDLVSLATGGWFGYENPEPLVPATRIQRLADGLARTTMKALDPAAVVAESTRDAGELLGALGWYGTHAGSESLREETATYIGEVADAIAGNIEGDGRIAGGGPNQAATQGIVAQGLLWAAQVEGVDRQGVAEPAIDYLLSALWDGGANTFKTGVDDDVYRMTVRDVGDVTGGLNAAGVLLKRDITDVYARYFDATVNRGRLQRAQRPPSRDGATNVPLPPAAGGEFGQAAVYNAAVEYDTASGEWSVTDDRFDTAGALYLANQEIWLSQWGGDFFQGRGVPGRNDSPK